MAATGYRFFNKSTSRKNRKIQIQNKYRNIEVVNSSLNSNVKFNKIRNDSQSQARGSGKKRNIDNIQITITNDRLQQTTLQESKTKQNSFSHGAPMNHYRGNLLDDQARNSYQGIFSRVPPGNSYQNSNQFQRTGINYNYNAGAANINSYGGNNQALNNNDWLLMNHQNWHNNLMMNMSGWHNYYPPGNEMYTYNYYGNNKQKPSLANRLNTPFNNHNYGARAYRKKQYAKFTSNRKKNKKVNSKKLRKKSKLSLSKNKNNHIRVVKNTPTSQYFENESANEESLSDSAFPQLISPVLKSEVTIENDANESN